MVVQPDGQILIGGSFSSVNGFPAAGLARLNGTQMVCCLNAQGRTPAGPFSLLLTGVPGATYEIQASTNLNTWESLMTVTNIHGRVQGDDPACANFSSRFYRARLID
jgi:hypothetical protein